jgi:hypothetical protein
VMHEADIEAWSERWTRLYNNLLQQPIQGKGICPILPSFSLWGRHSPDIQVTL